MGKLLQFRTHSQGLDPKEILDALTFKDDVGGTPTQEQIDEMKADLAVLDQVEEVGDEVKE